MRPYQERYLALLSELRRASDLPCEQTDSDRFRQSVRQLCQQTRQRLAEGTALLREELFPLLDNILSASREELEDLMGFADKLMSVNAQKDTALCYRIHLALMGYARHKKDRDLLIRELYWTGMSLHNLEVMLTPLPVHLFLPRIRMCFTECASYFDTDYDQITDPQIRGYIHRSMGNIALTYPDSDERSAKAKLAALKRSIAILSDPDVRAKTPSLPWDRFLLLSHQERTTLMNYLRSGAADPDVFAQVLESAQIVQRAQLRQAQQQDQPAPVRWQYAYFAALYHSGSIDLAEFLDVLYALSSALPDTDMSTQSMFSHLGAPSMYMEYARSMGQREQRAHAGRIRAMTERMCRWLATVITGDYNQLLMFHLRQMMYAYIELPGCISFFDLVQNVFAARHPTSYARMWRASQIARTLCLWAAEDCPEELIGVLGCASGEEVRARAEELGAFTATAGRLYDVGMLHFFDQIQFSCRGLLEEESGLLQLHPYMGAELLKRHPSVAEFADIAWGHHCHYDEKGGYPIDFSPRQSPLRGLIYIITAADCLSAATDAVGSTYSEPKDFDTVYQEFLDQSGIQSAPFVVELLRPMERRQYMAEALERWSRESYEDLKRRREAPLTG